METLFAALAPLVAALAGVLLAWLERRANKPNTIEHANTEPDLRDRWDAWVRERLQDTDKDNRD
jgi:hypothetical protein